jgi:hypothetical protein
MGTNRKRLACSRCGRRVSLRRRSAWPSPAGVVCDVCDEGPTLDVRELGRSMLKSFELAPAEYHHAHAVGESLAHQAYWKWQDDGAAIGRALDAQAIVAGLRYALFLAERQCGSVAPSAGRDGDTTKKKRGPSARRRSST